MNAVINDKPALDYSAIKQRQQATWASGDYAVIGTTLQIVGETLAEAADVRAGQTVLDVAAGNGNASLAAARRHARVTSTDYVQSLLDKGRARALAESLPMHFQLADAEALPFGDASFDIVLSTFGVMFTPDHRARRQRDAACAAPGRPHRAGQLDTGGLHRPACSRSSARMCRRPPACNRLRCGAPSRTSSSCSAARPRRSAASAGSSISATARRRTGCRCFVISTAPRTRPSRRSTLRRAQALEAAITALLDQHNIGGPGSLVVPSEYLEIVITKHGVLASGEA